MDFGGPISRSGACIDTVRALHQTITSLRAALEQSRSEIVELKSRSWPVEVEEAFHTLSIENHILRQKLLGNEPNEPLGKDNHLPNEENDKKSRVKLKFAEPKVAKPKKHISKHEQEKSDCDSDPNIYISTETISCSKVSKSLENLSLVKSPVEKQSSRKKLSKSRTVSFSNIFDGTKQISTTNLFHFESPQSSSLKSKKKCRKLGKASASSSDTNQRNLAQCASTEPKCSVKTGTKTSKKGKNLVFSEELLRSDQVLLLSGPDCSDTKQKAILKNKKKLTRPKSSSKVQTQLVESKENIETQDKNLLDLFHILEKSKSSDINSEDFNFCVEKSEALLEEIKTSPLHQKSAPKKKSKNLQKQTSKSKHESGLQKVNEVPEQSVDPLLKETFNIAQCSDFERLKVKQETEEEQESSNTSSETEKVLGSPASAEDQSDNKTDTDDVTDKKESQTPTISSENSETQTSSDNQAHKSPELGRKIEEVLFGTNERTSLEASEENKQTGANTEVQNLQIVANKSEALCSETKDSPDNLTEDIKQLLEDSNVKEEPQNISDIVEKSEPELEDDKLRETVECINNSYPEQSVDTAAEKKQEQQAEEKEKDETDTSNTLEQASSSDTGKTLNNVEISVKIFKGANKKPIEVDIQTKTLKRGKKKTAKRKMNDKSQNTSFDNDGIPCLAQTNVPLPREAIHRQVSTQNPQNVITSDNIVEDLLQNDAEQEVDDIELIFTTDDTKDGDFKEELVSIEPYASSQLLQCPLTDYDDKADVSDRELEDDVFNDNFENENQENCNFQSQTFDFRRDNSQLYNSKSDNSINHEDKSLKSYYSYQDSSFENKSLEKDESFDRFEEKVRIVETDISKVGIQDVDYNMGRRNTCPNPLQYRPIMHREALGRGLNSRKCRPILAHSNVVRKESGAQTDISAIPGSSWRSESSLANKVKVGENFTTLPSKFPHPGSRLRLSEKTVEARRILLSDIGFTSMVPELSRSADHLCPPNVKAPIATTYGQFLRTTDLYSPGYVSQKFMWTTTATPSEGSHSQSRYSSQYPLSSPPAPTRRCSAPVSPSKRTANIKSTPSRVRFANGSLPELRGDWTTTIDSGESTDSLVEEAEHFLRRSIDCLASGRDVYFRSEQPKGTVRRASAPEPSRDNVPPSGWQPFLPRVPRDLHLDYWVKVISQEGRVRGGRVRYVGPLMSQADQFVGVQLSTPDGHSDGTFNSRRYFNCEPYHGIFVPFKKIIMGWRP